MAGAGRRASLPHAFTRLRSAFTLTELMIATLLSLVVIGGLASLFTLFSRSMRQSQATVELNAMMRTAAWQLRRDLAGVTCKVGPTISPEDNAGYFELIEGPTRDTTYAVAAGQPTANLAADTDDLLLFTTQSMSEPFVGRFGSTLIESPYAEVAWFCRPLPQSEQPVDGLVLCNLYRRQVLVVNYLGRTDLQQNTLVPGTVAPNPAMPPPIVDRSRADLSLRQLPGAADGTALFPNSLGDLSKRENRFFRNGFSYLTAQGEARQYPKQPFPYRFPLDPETGHASIEATLDETTRAWEDVILRNVIAFDVRVFDPNAVPQQVGDSWRLPGELGYTAPATLPSGTPRGAYVDLGWQGGDHVSAGSAFPPLGKTQLSSAGVFVTAPFPYYQSLGYSKANLSPPAAPIALTTAAYQTPAGSFSLPPMATYDTWSRHYEFNGMDDDIDGVVDEGANGATINDPRVPEFTEDRETSPPYPVPLRGLEVRIRSYEPTSKQVRQITLRHAFPR